MKRIDKRSVKYFSHLAKNKSLFKCWPDVDASIVADFLATLPRELESKANLAIMTALRKTLQMERSSPLGEKLDKIFSNLLVEALRDFPDGKEKKELLSIGEISLDDANTVFDEASDLFERHIPYTQRVYGFFYQFYVRNEAHDSDIAKHLSKLSRDADELRKIFENIKDAESLDYVFKYRPMMPLEIILRELEDFKDNVEFAAKMVNTVVGGSCFLSPVLGFVTDEIGRNEEKESLFSRWERYLTAYDLHKKGVKSLIIAKTIQKQFGIWKTSSYPPTKLKSLVLNDIEQAEKMILSALKGTFPH